MESRREICAGRGVRRFRQAGKLPNHAKRLQSRNCNFGASRFGGEGGWRVLDYSELKIPGCGEVEICPQHCTAAMEDR